MINLMAVLAEAQLYDQWIPLTKKSVVLGKVSNFRQCAEFHYKLPWPLHPRAMYIGACGIQLPEENACILTLSSISGQSWLGHPIQRDPQICAIDVHKAAFYAKSLGENRQLLKIIANAEPHLDYIPKRLINFGLRSVCGTFLSLLERKCQNLQQEYVALIEEKKEFYDEVRQKMGKPDSAPKL